MAGRKSGDEFLTLCHILDQLGKESEQVALSSDVGCEESKSKPSSPLPKLITDMFIEVPQDKFRVDLSSTEIRNAMKGAKAPQK